MAQPALISVLLVDDQALVREGLRLILDLQSDIRVVAEAANGQEAVERAREHRPQVVLMDIQMPILDGVAATRALKAEFPNTAVIILTTFDHDTYVFEGLRAGAIGYLLKDTSSTQLADAIRAAARGESLLEPSVATRLVAEFSRLSEQARNPAAANARLPTPLTERELTVLAELVNGKTNRQIAAALFLTEGTVKNYVTQILSKLDAADRTQAALKARELKLV